MKELIRAVVWFTLGAVFTLVVHERVSLRDVNVRVGKICEGANP